MLRGNIFSLPESNPTGVFESPKARGNNPPPQFSEQNNLMAYKSVGAHLAFPSVLLISADEGTSLDAYFLVSFIITAITVAKYFPS